MIQVEDILELHRRSIDIYGGAVGESLIVNHPFVDGNKRTGFLAMIALVQEDDFFFMHTKMMLMLLQLTYLPAQNDSKKLLIG